MVLEKTLESPLDSKEIKPVNCKGNQSWIFIGRTDAEAEAPIFWPPDVEELIPWKRPWCWQRLKAGREGDDRGWDGWMASPTRWTWTWASFRSWWWTGWPGVLQSMRSQSGTHLSNWTEPWLYEHLKYCGQFFEKLKSYYMAQQFPSYLYTWEHTKYIQKKITHIHSNVI